MIYFLYIDTYRYYKSESEDSGMLLIRGWNDTISEKKQKKQWNATKHCLTHFINVQIMG